MIISTSYHYRVDYHRYKLDRFDQLNNHLNLTPYQKQYADEIRQHLFEDNDRALSDFKRIGAPYVHDNFSAEILYISMMTIVDCLYVQTQLYYKFYDEFNYSIVYTMIAPTKLQEPLDTVIRDAVNGFIESSRLYSSLLIDQKVGVSRPDEEENDAVEPRPTPEKHPQATRIAMNHKFLVHQVKCLAFSGVFQPYNRREEQINNITETYSRLTLFTFFAGIVWLVGFLLVVPYTFLGANFGTDPMDVLFVGEMMIYVSTSNIATTFYITGVTIGCVDQLHLVSNLGSLIDNCISENTYRLGEDLTDYDMRAGRESFRTAGHCSSISVAPVKWSPLRNHRLFAQNSMARMRMSIVPRDTLANVSRHATPMMNNIIASAGRAIKDMDSSKSYELVDKNVNLTLMHALLHYRIFVKQLRPQLSTTSISATVAVFLSSVMPVLIRLLMAYLDSQRKMFTVVVCVSVLLLADIVLVVNCRFHARCSDLYKHLHSLMAHTVKMDQVVRARTGRGAYDEHLVWLLRRELDDPEKLLDQFATRFLVAGSQLTFGGLVKYHFWWGFLVISIMALDPTKPNAADVFGGVWRFFNQADVEVNELFYHYIRNSTLGFDPTTRTGIV